jgi:cytoskeletal protein RodZ
MLNRIEDDRFDELPGEVFARGFLKSYARALGVPENDVLERYDAHRKPEPEAVPAPITAITPPERGRRFGMAIALVILLILFTLALSIVLRPRHRDTPIELSSATTTAPASAELG